MKPVWKEEGQPVRVFDLSVDERKKQLKQQQAESEKRNVNYLSMLNTSMPLTAGPHALLGPTGSGKTNTVANIVRAALNSTKGDVIAILNEETPADFIQRLACLELMINMSDVKKGLLTPDQKERLDKATMAIVGRVRTFGGDGGWNVNLLEDVLELTIRSATSGGISLVVVDYLQNINESKTSANPFEISKLFGTRLKEIGKIALCPIVIACQIRKGHESYSTRVQNDRTFVNNCASVIEIAVDFNNKLVDLIIRKDRWFGNTDQCFSFDFICGNLQFSKQERRVIPDEWNIKGD